MSGRRLLLEAAGSAQPPPPPPLSVLPLRLLVGVRVAGQALVPLGLLLGRVHL